MSSMISSNHIYKITITLTCVIVLSSLQGALNESVFWRAILALLPFVLIKAKKLHFYYGVGVICIYISYLLSLNSIETHDLRAILLYSQLTLALFFYYESKNKAINARIIKIGPVILYFISILLMANLIIPYISGIEFSINLDVFNEERYRGYFPTLLAIALVVLVDNKLFKIGLGLFFAVIIFAANGSRGGAVIFTAIVFGVVIFKPKHFYIYLSFLYVAVYPVFLIMLSMVNSIVGSFLVKSDGFQFLINNLTLFGHGIQPPSTEGLARVDIYGIHFSAADYGIYGIAYELGIPALVLCFFLGIRMYKLVSQFADQRLAYLYSYIAASFAFTYSIARNYEELIMIFLFYGILLSFKRQGGFKSEVQHP